MASATNRRDTQARRLTVKALLDELERAVRQVNPARLRAYLRGTGRKGRKAQR